MSLFLGHRGFSARHLENSMEAFRAAVAAGMDGFELDVQPTTDGVSLVLHDDDFSRTAMGGGVLRKMKFSEAPKLKNGEKVPSLSDVLDIPAKLINVELKGEPGWEQALATVIAKGALGRVLFSSFEHGEILQLLSACPEARCGFLWEEADADKLTVIDIGNFPTQLMLHPPLASVAKRKDFWRPYASRIALWGIKTPKDAEDLGFAPAIFISDGI